MKDGEIKVTVIATGFDQPAEFEVKRMKAFREEELEDKEVIFKKSKEEEEKEAKDRLESERERKLREAEKIIAERKAEEEKKKNDLEDKKTRFIDEVESEEDMDIPAFIRNKLR